MKPAKDGRFPVVAWSHARNVPAGMVNETSQCQLFVVNDGWMLFFALSRGYGGSEGPSPADVFGQNPMVFLHGRADDLNTGVEWLKTRPDVNPACIVNMGWSHGGVTAILACGRNPLLYRATLVQAPGVLPGLDSALGMDDMIRAGKNIPTPILIQSNSADPLIWVEGTRALARELQRWGRAVEYKEYTHPSGHFLFNLPASPGLLEIWGVDATRFIERAFSGCAAQ